MVLVSWVLYRQEAKSGGVDICMLSPWRGSPQLCGGTRSADTWSRPQKLEVPLGGATERS